MLGLNLPNNTLVLVASGSEAKVFRSNKSGLKEDGHWTPKDLADDGPSGKMPTESSNREIDEATFSKQLSEQLYQMAHRGDFQHLILIADPNTLGEMRPQLHQEVTNKISMEIDKTLVNSPIEDIENTIAKNLK